MTEMVTGVDLIAEQIRAAQGEVLRLKQEDIQLKVRQYSTENGSPHENYNRIALFMDFVFDGQTRAQPKASVLSDLQPLVSCGAVSCLWMPFTVGGKFELASVYGMMFC